jgi:hypothetical protein
MTCILVTSQESVDTHALLANRGQGCGAIKGVYGGPLREVNLDVAHSTTYSSVTHGNTNHCQRLAVESLKYKESYVQMFNLLRRTC